MFFISFYTYLKALICCLVPIRKPSDNFGIDTILLTLIKTPMHKEMFFSLQKIMSNLIVYRMNNNIISKLKSQEVQIYQNIKY